MEPQDAGAEYVRAAIEYGTLVARNYTLTQRDLGTSALPEPLTAEQAERLGRVQHQKHVALYEARERLLAVTARASLCQ